MNKKTRLVAASLAIGSGMLSAYAISSPVGAAGTPSQDGQGAINGILPVVDANGNLRRDASGNLVGFDAAAMKPSLSPAARAAQPGDQRTVSTVVREVGPGQTQVRKVETVVVKADPAGDAFAGRRLVSIPGTAELGR